MKTWLLALMCLAAVACAQPSPEELARQVVMLISPVSGFPIGTGVIVSPDRVLTAAHVVTKGNGVVIFFHDGEASWGEVVTMRPGGLDIAVLKIESPKGYSPAVVSCHRPAMGEWVQTINHTYPFKWAYAVGHVAIATQLAGDKDTDIVLAMPSARGASGAPVFNQAGVVIGIITAWATQPAVSRTPTDAYTAIGFTYMAPMELICRAGVSFDIAAGGRDED